MTEGRPPSPDRPRRAPAWQSKQVLIQAGVDYHAVTGEVPSLPKVCDLVGRTTGYGYQQFTGPQYRAEVQAAIVRQPWFDLEGGVNWLQVLRALQQPWQKAEIAEALREQVASLEWHRRQLEDLEPGPGPQSALDLPGQLWEALQTLGSPETGGGS